MGSLFQDPRYRAELNVRDYRPGGKDMSLEIQNAKLNTKPWEDK